MGDDSEIANLISEAYLASNCRYGYRKITRELQSAIAINHKKVARIMRSMGIVGLYPRRSIQTTIAAMGHEKFPYLLGSLEIVRPNHVWATDITYIWLYDSFVYLVAIIDIFSRYIVGYELSHSLEASFCVELLRRVLNVCRPEIFNTDQGAQFTSNDFIAMLRNYEVKISMDHRGRCFDNIIMERFWRTLKQEAIYFMRPENIVELERVVGDFVCWYNNTRLHQSLGYKTPLAVYLG